MSGTLIPFALATTGSGVLQDVSVGDGSLRFSAEGHRSFGGTDSSPSPLDYALAALTSCTQVTSQIVASQKPEVRLGRWRIDLEAHLDAAVLATGAQGISNFSDVHLAIDVETNLGGEAFDSFAAEVERRCPVTQLFRGSGVKFSSTWTPKPLATVDGDRKVA